MRGSGRNGTIKPWDEQGAPGALGIWEPLTIISPSLFPCSQVLEDLEEQLYCSAFEEAALTRRICSELQFFPGGMIGMAWAGPAPSSLSSDPTSCWLPLDMELLHRQVLALQTQRVLLGM